MFFKKMTIEKKLREFLNAQSFGNDIFNEYYAGNVEGYREDKKRFDKAVRESLNLLYDLKEISESEISEACKRAFMGRLEWSGGQFSYTAGQFYDLEVPQAVQSVLEHIKDNRNQ